eukprot:224541-Pleurochrysis_carterae.AAC.3
MDGGLKAAADTFDRGEVKARIEKDTLDEAEAEARKQRTRSGIAARHQSRADRAKSTFVS